MSTQTLAPLYRALFEALRDDTLAEQLQGLGADTKGRNRLLTDTLTAVCAQHGVPFTEVFDADDLALVAVAQNGDEQMALLSLQIQLQIARRVPAPTATVSDTVEKTLRMEAFQGRRISAGE